MRFYHNSRDLNCRQPFGAVPCNTPITLCFYSSQALKKVQLRLWQGVSTYISMEYMGFGKYEAKVSAPERPLVWWYDFLITTQDDRKLYYGNAMDELGGEGSVSENRPPSFQITVYDPAFKTPKWLREGVMYQIFPDRFHREKLPSSNRTDIYLHENWSDIPSVTPDPRSGDNQAFDFFGGTLEGIRQKLDYLEDLGITVLYLNPIFKARSNHRYDTGDYMRVDPLLGTNDDLKRLCKDAKARGIRVILDGVFSHTGEDSLYFDRYGNYGGNGAYQGKSSPYYAWYQFRRFPDDYACWWNIPTLPEVNKNNPHYNQFINGEKGVVRTWLHRGISGWRLDVADELPMHFLENIRTASKTEKSDAAIIGEVWEDASRKIAYGHLRSYCLGTTVDSVMNYPLRDALINFFVGRINAAKLVRIINSLQENYPTTFFYSLMNLPGSHDRARILNVLSDYEYTSIPWKERGKMKLSAKAKALGKSRLKKMLQIIFSLPGLPAIYYGDEAGMEGAADPFNRATFPWDNIDKELHEFTRDLVRKRHENPVLKTGFLSLSAQGEDSICLVRHLKNGKDAFGQKLEGDTFFLRITRDYMNRRADD